MKEVYIVGAHSRGQTLKEYLAVLYPDVIVLAYLVTDSQDNERKVDNIPVLLLNKTAAFNVNAPVLIGTKGIYHQKIVRELKGNGFKKIYPITVDVDMELRNRYVEKVFTIQNKKFEKIEKNSQLDIGLQSNKENYLSCFTKIYVANSVFDSKIMTDYEFLPQEVLIQVGTALTGKRIQNASEFDSQGMSISKKNKQYCELTALYWIWKNAKEDIVGLVHYRRHFLLPEDWVAIMNENHIDVILPVPLFVAPNIHGNYIMRHNEKEWNLMMSYLEKERIEDFPDATEFFNQGLYSPCNMIIARKPVLDEFCAWLFPILDYVVEQSGEKEDPYQNRYPGFLSERLMSYYFNQHRDKYKVVYADKNFLT